MFKYRFYWNSTNLVLTHGDNYISNGQRTRVPSMDGYRPGDNLTLAYEGTIEPDRGCTHYGKELTAKLWRMFNAPFERPNDYAGPSMSVGDVVVIEFNGHIGTFACERVGFVLIFNDLGNTLPQNPRFVRTPTQLKTYLRAKSEYVQLTDEEDEIAYSTEGR